MDFVEDVNLPVSGRCLPGVGGEITYGIDAVIRGRVQFNNVEGSPLGNRNTTRTLTTSIALNRLFAVQCFGEYARSSCLSGSSRTRKEIGVVHLSRRNRPLERSNDVVLSTEFAEASGTKAAIEGGGVRHRTSVMVATDIFRVSSEVQSGGQAIRGTRLNPLRAAGFHP